MKTIATALVALLFFLPSGMAQDQEASLPEADDDVVEEVVQQADATLKDLYALIDKAGGGLGDLPSVSIPSVIEIEYTAGAGFSYLVTPDHAWNCLGQDSSGYYTSYTVTCYHVNNGAQCHDLRAEARALSRGTWMGIHNKCGSDDANCHTPGVPEDGTPQIFSCQSAVVPTMATSPWSCRLQIPDEALGVYGRCSIGNI